MPCSKKSRNERISKGDVGVERQLQRTPGGYAQNDMINISRIFKRVVGNSNKTAGHFLITSGGQTGVIWLGSMLHLHPDIVCSTGTDHPLMSLNYEYNESELLKIRAGIRNAADMPYGAAPHLQSKLELGGFFKYDDRHEINRFKDIFAPMKGVNQRDERYKANIFEELKALAKFKECKAWGNVRGLSAQDYLLETKKGNAAFRGCGDALVVVDLIRHPIQRLDSVVNWCHSFYELYPDVRKLIDDALLDKSDLLSVFEKNHGADFSKTLDRAFFYAEIVVEHSRLWAADVNAGPHIRRILFERLREDRDYFADLIKTVTRGSVFADTAYLDLVFSAENHESGRMTDIKFRKARRSAREVYESWPEWHQAQVSDIFKRHDLASVYQPYGYDLSFLS